MQTDPHSEGKLYATNFDKNAYFHFRQWTQAGGYESNRLSWDSQDIRAALTGGTSQRWHRTDSCTDVTCRVQHAATTAAAFM
jgi:hypothetical protein